jgi:hypothetical protein
MKWRVEHAISCGRRDLVLSPVPHRHVAKLRGLGPTKLLRERVGALDADQRAMLHEALDGVATAVSR